jgi:putative tricarboxylic transport membrane protein
MKTTPYQKRKACLALGGMGLLLATGYMWMSFQLPFGAREQPGAALFPVIIGVVLCFASLAAIWEGWKMDKAGQINLPAGSDRKRLLSVVGLMLGYFLALDLLGQIITSTVFCILLVRLLSDINWPRVLAYSLAMSIALNVVFIFMFKIPMPRGILYYYYVGN